MFDDIGKKIKSLVKTIFAIEVILFALLIMVFGLNPLSFFITLAGVLLAWISSFVMYGFGELIDNSQKQSIQNDKIISLLSAEPLISTKHEGVGSRIKKMESSGLKSMTITED